MKRLLLAALLAPLCVLAGPFDEPWVIVTTDSAPSTDPNLRPVTVSRVDGEFVSKNRAVVTPGLRLVTVGLPPRKGSSLGTQETIELMASPCMRYHIAAKLDTAPGGEWKAVVRSSESIGECLTKFRGGTTPK